MLIFFGPTYGGQACSLRLVFDNDYFKVTKQHKNVWRKMANGFQQYRKNNNEQTLKQGLRNFHERRALEI